MTNEFKEKRRGNKLADHSLEEDKILYESTEINLTEAEIKKIETGTAIPNLSHVPSHDEK